MDKCIYCQLETSNKVYANSNWQNNFCSKHKHKMVSSGESRGSRDNPLDNIGDGIDLDREDRMKRAEEIAQQRKDEQFWSGK